MKYIIFNLISLFIYNFICKILKLFFIKKNKNSLNKIISNDGLYFPYDLEIPDWNEFDNEFWNDDEI